MVVRPWVRLKVHSAPEGQQTLSKLWENKCCRQKLDWVNILRVVLKCGIELLTEAASSEVNES